MNDHAVTWRVYPNVIHGSFIHFLDWECTSVWVQEMNEYVSDTLTISFIRLPSPSFEIEFEEVVNGKNSIEREDEGGTGDGCQGFVHHPFQGVKRMVHEPDMDGDSLIRSSIVQHSWTTVSRMMEDWGMDVTIILTFDCEWVWTRENECSNESNTHPQRMWEPSNNFILSNPNPFRNWSTLEWRLNDSWKNGLGLTHQHQSCLSVSSRVSVTTACCWFVNPELMSVSLVWSLIIHEWWCHTKTQPHQSFANPHPIHSQFEIELGIEVGW